MLIASLNQPERPGGFLSLTFGTLKAGATRQAELLNTAPGETIQLDIKMKPRKK